MTRFPVYLFIKASLSVTARHIYDYHKTATAFPAPEKKKRATNAFSHQ
jgi:hypothetical protein